MTKIRLPIITFVLGLVLGGTLTAMAVQNPPAQPLEPGVTGIGGVFFKADNPAGLRAWYEQHLGIKPGQPGTNFFWRDPDNASQYGLTVWSLFPRDGKYFGPGEQDFMVDYRVRDLDALLKQLDKEGIPQIGETEDYWYGRFAWIADGEGNRVELWQPVDFSPAEYDRRLSSESRQ